MLIRCSHRVHGLSQALQGRYPIAADRSGHITVNGRGPKTVTASEPLNPGIFQAETGSRRLTGKNLFCRKDWWD